MQINVSGHHVEITEAMQAHVEEKMGKISRHFDNVTKAQVTLTVENDERHRAEATIHVSGADMNASADSDDMYAAIDAMIDKLDRQVLKHKEKRVAR
ncbi:hypothetical protein A3759_30745, partial [Thalassolituus sp. HI0120]